MSKKWYFYVLSCRDNSLYTGVTTDVQRRLKEHNLAKGAKYTRSRLPVTLLYFQEMPNRSIAQKREYKFKKLSRNEKLSELCKMVDKELGL